MADGGLWTVGTVGEGDRDATTASAEAGDWWLALCSRADLMYDSTRSRRYAGKFPTELPLLSRMVLAVELAAE